MITSTQALEKACVSLSKASYITVDTEFMRDSTFWPKLCLIQVAGPHDELIIDPLAKGIDLASFYELMLNRSVIKVFHAARQDIEIFYHEARAIPDPLFDSQVAAMVCGFGESVGYETLVRKLANGQVDKSSRFTDWSRRPLTEKQLTYAIADVTHLRKIYDALARQLAGDSRVEWVTEEMAILQNPETYALLPENAWKRMKMRVKGPKAFAVLIEVAAWRERQAQERDTPRNRVLKDDALFELANQQPKDVSALDNLRAVPRGFSNSRAAASLIEAIKVGLARDKNSLPPIKEVPALPSGIGPLVELLKVLLKMRSEENNVATKLIANVSDLEQIAASDTADVAALTGWRREMFGNDALALKGGELAISAKGRRLRLTRLQPE
ncbi:MAG: ribonuclease D [Rhodobiaceae bacterium]|nr:MAG: ribonuclease D [Rhodobiaceae bacterium]